MILMLTAAGAPHERVTGLALGADDYLAKPFHFPELVLRVRALARRKPTAGARTLRTAGIELDPTTGTVPPALHSWLPAISTGLGTPVAPEHSVPRLPVWVLY